MRDNSEFRGRTEATLENINKTLDNHTGRLTTIEEKLDTYIQQNVLNKWMAGISLTWLASLTGYLVMVFLK